MNNIYKIIITAIIIIILFITFLFQEEINNFFTSLVRSSSNTTPSDCPDYWIKYSNHKNSSTNSATYGCYINAIKQPDVVYNGGKCNYINGVRTNFGSMPNYCDVSQSYAVGDNLNLSNARSGVNLVDGWQSFFKIEKLPAVVSIAPQQPKKWVPGIDIDGTDASDNDHLELRYVGVYQINNVSHTGTNRIYTLVQDNPITLSNTQSFSGPSYTITGVDGFDTQDATILNNYGYTSNLHLDEPINALTTELNKYYKNIYKCNTDRLNDYVYTDEYGLSTQRIACPTTWRATIPDLPVDTSYVLIYVGGKPPNYNISETGRDSSGAYVVSIYDKLTKSYITKELANVLATGDSIKLKKSTGEIDILDDLTYNSQSLSSYDVTNISPTLYIGYVDIYIPYYDPNTSDGFHNTVAGYEMSVFDNLNYCQKRTWAMKNDIHWSGITDNPTLTKCNENDFFSPVNFDVSFSLTATLNQECLYYDASGELSYDASGNEVDNGYRPAGYFDGEGNECIDPSNTLVTTVTPINDTLSWAYITNF